MISCIAACKQRYAIIFRALLITVMNKQGKNISEFVNLHLIIQRNELFRLLYFIGGSQLFDVLSIDHRMDQQSHILL